MSVERAFAGPRIGRAEAVARVVAERADAGCLMCELLDGRAGSLHVLERGAAAIAVLARYALRPGHALVIARHHQTSIAMLDEGAWIELATVARRACVAIDAVFAPGRCFVASLGTDADVPMSSPHVHLHVVPVARGERPREVLTWEHGVFVPSDVDLGAVAARLRAAWPTSGLAT
jgi:diadenosine tetraphosphate (Ap4A) HIT family hydrolase